VGAWGERQRVAQLLACEWEEVRSQGRRGEGEGGGGSWLDRERAMGTTAATVVVTMASRHHRRVVVSFSAVVAVVVTDDWF
jgi:hypothetical protein